MDIFKIKSTLLFHVALLLNFTLHILSASKIHNNQINVLIKGLRAYHFFLHLCDVMSMQEYEKTHNIMFIHMQHKMAEM